MSIEENAAAGTGQENTDTGTVASESGAAVVETAVEAKAAPEVKTTKGISLLGGDEPYKDDESAEGAGDGSKADGDEAAKGDGEKTEAEKQAELDAEAAKEEKPKEAPEKYDFKTPEGFEALDPVLIEKFEPLARKLDLSGEKANELITEMMPTVMERVAESHREAWMSQTIQWVQEVKADKEIGGKNFKETLVNANNALDKFGTPELKALLASPTEANRTGLGIGNHPELMRFFAKLGKASKEDVIINDGVTAADSQTGGLYGHLNKT